MNCRIEVFPNDFLQSFFPLSSSPCHQSILLGLTINPITTNSVIFYRRNDTDQTWSIFKLINLKIIIKYLGDKN